MKVDYVHFSRTPGAAYLDVFDLHTRQKLDDVIEANARDGWVRLPRRDGKGVFVLEGGIRVIDRVERSIEIRVRADCPPAVRALIARQNAT